MITRRKFIKNAALGIAGAAIPLAALKIAAIVEPHVGNERQAAVVALQRLAIVNVFWERAEQPAPHRQRAIRPGASVMRAIDFLRRQHGRAIVLNVRLAVEAPEASNRTHGNLDSGRGRWIEVTEKCTCSDSAFKR